MAAEQHTFQILTKRPGRMRTLLSSPSFQRAVTAEVHGQTHSRDSLRWPLPNVWAGVSAETQRWANVRLPVLLGT